MIIVKGLDGKDKGEMRQDSSRKKILPFEFVVLEACLEAVISSLENEVCALYSLNLFLNGEYAKICILIHLLFSKLNAIFSICIHKLNEIVSD